MKALLSRVSGGPETLEFDDVATPAPGRDEILVAVTACAINYPDVLMIEDKYQARPPRPFAPGAEVSGRVEAVGEGVEGWAVGDRVIATTSHGGLAEKVVVPQAQAFSFPTGLDLSQGAALLLTYATAIHALSDRGELKAGETLLVLGAAGGVGLAAIEIGKALGASVVAAVSSEEKAAAARTAGADATVIYGRGPFDKAASRGIADQFKAAVGSTGADVVFDPVGGDYAEPAIRSLAWAGRYLVIGFTAGIPAIPLNLLLLQERDVRGVFWGAFAARAPFENRAHVTRLLRWWEEGRINPLVSQTWPLARGGEAIATMKDRKAVGKLLVKIGAHR